MASSTQSPRLRRDFECVAGCEEVEPEAGLSSSCNLERTVNTPLLEDFVIEKC